jgi:hypothetical protein
MPGRRYVCSGCRQDGRDQFRQRAGEGRLFGDALLSLLRVPAASRLQHIGLYHLGLMKSRAHAIESFKLR